MRVWLVWRRSDERTAGLPAESVGARLSLRFGTIAGKPLRVRAAGDAGLGVVSVELPWVGWAPAFFQEDQHTCAMAADYPINAGLALKGVTGVGDTSIDLPALCRSLEASPGPLLEQLAPPFAAVWWSKPLDKVTIQNDGLGQSQVFEYEDGGLWAASNKIAAFSALGVRLQPEPLEWAAWSTIGWFPLQMTGYKGVRFVEPGTRLRVRDSGVERDRYDVLARWVSPGGLSPDQCLESSRESLLEHIRAAAPLWDGPEVGLTGGWDSRAVVSSMMAAEVPFAATVRGMPCRPDVVIASELARIAGLELRVQGSGGLPPEVPGECARCISRALLWQGGHAAAHRHKTFMAGRDRLKLRVPSVTGQHGEMARRERALFDDHQARRLRASDLSEPQYEGITLSAILEDMPTFLRPELKDTVREVVQIAYRAGDRYGLTGLRRVDFFCLNEFTRRKGSAVHAWQARAVVAPFLNPGFIRAVFGYPARREANVFHRHIIGTNLPDWLGVPFNDELETCTPPFAAAASGLETGWKRPTGRESYDSALYWRTVGTPLIDEALANGGFWTEVLDPDVTKDRWHERPDLLPILYLLGRDRPSE